MSMSIDSSTVSVTAGVIAAFAVAMLFFRIQRELHMQEKGEVIWIPWADWQLLSGLLLALLLVLLPLGASQPGSWAYQSLPIPGCAAALMLTAFYPFSILAHYQLILANGRTLPRFNPEPSERALVIVAVIVALIAATVAQFVHAH